MSDAAWQPIADAIERGDGDAVVEHLAALDEPGRTRLSTPARRALTAHPEVELGGQPSWEEYERKDAQNRAAWAAVFGTGGSAAAAKIWWRPPERDQLVRCRPRDWRQDFAERVMAVDDDAGFMWRTVHAMVKEGEIDRPQAAGYVTGAVHGMRLYDDPISLADTLRDERDWLARDLWELLAAEGAALNGRDHAREWHDALVELAADGTIDRRRLLDTTVAALRRDLSAYDCRWFVSLHEALKPEPDERLPYLDDLLALLASEHDSLVGFAIKTLAKLEPQLPAERLAEAVPPALLCSTKGHAVRAVELTGRVLERAPELAPVLLDALAHDSRDVQEPALTLLERHGVPVDDERRANLDPALRPNLKGPGPFKLAVAPDPSRLTEPLRPPESVEEVLDRVAVVLERDDDPDEIELLLDAISRFRDAPVDPGRAQALRERAYARTWADANGIVFLRAHHALATVLLRWLGDETVVLGPTGLSPREAIAQRVRELLDDPRPRELLGTPTHRGGWIDPREAVERLARAERTPEMDLAQLVLRLAPDHREEALASAGGILAYALGGEAERGSGPAWDAAAHARAPARWKSDPRPIDDVAAMQAIWSRGEAVRVDPASPADLLTLGETSWFSDDGTIERWLTTVWPANQEGALELAARRLTFDGGTGDHAAGAILEVLLDPREPIGEWGSLAIALALGHSDITVRTLAVDIASAALPERRLDGARLGTQLASVLHLGVPARWAASLADVAAVGNASDIQVAIEAMLAKACVRDRRRMLGLVDLLRRLATEAGTPVADPQARTWLESLSPGSKIGRAAREALEI